jgi:hypothetical protein
MTFVDQSVAAAVKPIGAMSVDEIQVELAAYSPCSSCAMRRALAADRRALPGGDVVAAPKKTAAARRTPAAVVVCRHFREED